MRVLTMVVVLVLSACAVEPAEMLPLSCDGDVVVCDGEALCDGEYQSQEPGTGPAYLACDSEGVVYCRQRVNFADAPRPEQTPVCVR